jgi:hypothetical protein
MGVHVFHARFYVFSRFFHTRQNNRDYMNVCQTSRLEAQREEQSMKTSALFLRFIWLILVTGVLLTAHTPLANAQEVEPAPAISYIAVSAKLQGCLALYPPTYKPTCRVIVKGVTNLPENSVLRIDVYDYIGQGSKSFNEVDTVTVGSTGEFTAAVQAKPGLRMRANLQVHVVFFPGWNQPACVADKFGRRGEKLNGPQIGGNAGGLYLNAITAVME